MPLFLKLGIFLLFTSLTYSQEVHYADQTYTVEGDKILQSGVDITRMLTIEKRETIQRRASRPKKNKIQKRVSKSENNTIQRRASKPEDTKIQKRASKPENNIPKKSKKRSTKSTNLDEVSNELKDVYNTYGKLKRAGNISRSDETELLEKIEKLKAKLAKMESKLNKTSS